MKMIGSSIAAVTPNYQGLKIPVGLGIENERVIQRDKIHKCTIDDCVLFVGAAGDFSLR